VVEQKFAKVSGFYTKDSINYEKKLCNFQVIKQTVYSEDEVGDIEMDMSEFVF